MSVFWRKSRGQTEGADWGLETQAVRLFRTAEKDDVYTFSYLVHLLRPSSPERLALVLSDLVSKQAIDRVVRVSSRRGGGIGDFRSVTEVPSEIYDRRIGTTFEVEPTDIQILFGPHDESRRLEPPSASR